ncbi:MAG TPA: hypothetical protein VLT87_25845, partial [Thermoanaerobaculia bacterium]|nr:hypothetical protein [Thermoanaerobaculia bacterium]
WAAAPAFDLILLKEDNNLRGRKRGETGALLRDALVAAGFPEDRISPGIYNEEEAVQRALETAQPGDLLVIFGDDLEHVWRQIVSFGRPPEAPRGPAPVAPPIFAPETDPPLESPVSPVPLPQGERVGKHED